MITNSATNEMVAEEIGMSALRNNKGFQEANKSL
jgi:hypothetical protein